MTNDLKTWRKQICGFCGKKKISKTHPYNRKEKTMECNNKKPYFKGLIK